MMGYVPTPPPIQLNLDRFGIPRDFASYMWLLYGRRVTDKSPARLAFLHGPKADLPSFGLQMAWR